MLRAHFRLTLSAPARSIVRLLQMTDYAWQRARAGGDPVPMPAELSEAFASFAPGISPERTYADLFGDVAPGWVVQPGSGTEVALETVADGASPITVACAIAIAAPEAFTGDMRFTAKQSAAVN